MRNQEIQRYIKEHQNFFIKAYSQVVKTYMLYNERLDTLENKKTSNTSIFGTNMFLTLGVEILGKENLIWFKNV